MKKTHYFAGVTIALFLSGCNNSKFEGFTQAENGLYYKFFNHDENGTKIQDGDGVTLRYIISNQKNDSLIVDSKDASRDGSGYAQFVIHGSTFKGSLEDGMMMMTKGDSAEFIVPADSFFIKSMKQNELPKGINPGDYVKAIFKIKNVITKKELEENQKMQMAEQEKEMKERQVMEQPAIDKYLAENKITAKPTASGLYYIETKKGTGAGPTSADIVKVHYTGKFLDGKTFDSSVDRGEPIEFQLNQVIPGWTEGLQLMKKGGKAQLIIPSAIAYGPQGRQGIPPYSPLYFEVELIDFKPAPPPAAAPPQPEGNPQQGK